jgi:hypothetical protein
VFWAAVARQVEIFKKLVSDRHPARIQDCPKPTINQFENGHVGFEGMQDKDLLCLQAALGLSLGEGRDWARYECTDQEEEKNMGPNRKSYALEQFIDHRRSP